MTTRSHSVTGTFLGRTKVRGDEYLTDGLALSVLRRQMEKGSINPEVRFTDDYIHFYNTDRHGRAKENIPYGMIRKIYTFYDNPDILMTCSDMIYEDGKYYSSFRLRNSDDVKRARKLISGAHRETRPRARTISHTYTSRPARTTFVRYEPDRTVCEPNQYRLISRTYRSASRSPSPIYIERAETTTPVVGTAPVAERVIPARTPSPFYVQPVSTLERTYAKPTETYVNETPAEPVVYRRVNRPAEGSVRTTYVSRPSVTYMDTYVPSGTGSLSRQYIGDELEDQDIVLKRVSKVAPATR